MMSSSALALKPSTPPEKGGAAPAEATTPPPSSLASRFDVGADEGWGEGTGEYERRRDERIRENMERMQRLGIVDLAHKFRSSISGGSAARKRVYSKRATPSPDLPPRRSSRLQNVTPVSYSEKHGTGEGEMPQKKMRISLEEGPIEEVYTDEHEKLLGTCETSWTLFVDGYSKFGGRIYDQVKGKTCHQCRQKTLGQRTCCSKCSLVQGQFCGDCLYMRYGENVLEANKNPNWICPVCRGICNCSLCRVKKGWAPTGILYKKIVRLGFKSVAHFLIQTKRAQINTEGLLSAHPIPVKRSLPFTDEVGPLQISNCNNNNDDNCNKGMIFYDGNKDEDTECGRDGNVQALDAHGSISTLGTGKMVRKGQKIETESALTSRSGLLNHGVNNNNKDHCNRQIVPVNLDSGSLLFCENGKDAGSFGDEEMQMEKCDGSPMLQRSGKIRKKQEEMQLIVSVSSPDSISGRLRSNPNEGKGAHNPDECIGSIALENGEKVDKSSKEKDPDLVTVPSLGSITGRQRAQSIFKKQGDKHSDKADGCKREMDATLESNRRSGGRPNKRTSLALMVKPSMDCIAGRLRSRSSSCLHY